MAWTRGLATTIAPIPGSTPRAGFLVVMPDYRGHNTSEGLQYAGASSRPPTTRRMCLRCWRACRSSARRRGQCLHVGALPGRRGDAARPAGDRPGQGRFPVVNRRWRGLGPGLPLLPVQEPEALDAASVEKASITELKRDIAALGEPYDWAAREPLRCLRYLHTPLILHHSIADAGAQDQWSERLAKELYLAGLPYVFHTYPGSDHLFQGQTRRQAVDRDVAFFRSLMQRADAVAPR